MPFKITYLFKTVAKHKIKYHKIVKKNPLPFLINNVWFALLHLTYTKASLNFWN